MADPAAWAASLAAGACCAVAVAAPFRRPSGMRSAWRPVRRPRLQVRPSAPAWLPAALEQAGVSEPPARTLAVLGALTLATTCAGAAAGSLGDTASALGLAALGLLAGPCFAALLLRAAIAARRERLRSQLTPLLELLSLELSAGSAAGSALESVTGALGGELAADLRRLLTASRLGAAPLDTALAGYGERHRLPALATLGGLVAASREYGSSLSTGVRQLAAELRREERRTLIAASRRALNRILVPAALGVLAPFMGILLYPALTTLARSLG